MNLLLSILPIPEVFEGRVQLQRVRGNDNHVAFAFADDGYSSDWIQLNQQAEALASRIPLDFPALLKRLRQGAVK